MTRWWADATPAPPPPEPRLGDWRLLGLTWGAPSRSARAARACCRCSAASPPASPGTASPDQHTVLQLIQISLRRTIAATKYYITHLTSIHRTFERFGGGKFPRQPLFKVGSRWKNIFIQVHLIFLNGCCKLANELRYFWNVFANFIPKMSIYAWKTRPDVKSKLLHFTANKL